jgi:hypothetical protein
MTAWSPRKMARAAAWHRLHGRHDMAAQIEAQLVAGRRCRRCGRALTDAGSIETAKVDGLGPECRGREHRP